MLVGLSRKTFLAQKRELPPKRKAQTLAANLVAAQNGADILRVHDVRDTRKVLEFYKELEGATCHKSI
jgi:dihydropteroate synthase